MKRSTTAKLVLMGLAPLFLAACDDPAPEASSQTFTTVDSCVASGVPKATCQTAHDEAQRLNRLVRNLLDMTRLEAGALGRVIQE